MAVTTAEEESILEQLRDILSEAGDAALASGKREEAIAHQDAIHSLRLALQKALASPASDAWTLDINEFPALRCDFGSIVLTVCGFETCGAHTYQLSSGAFRGCHLAMVTVSAYLDAFNGRCNEHFRRLEAAEASQSALDQQNESKQVGNHAPQSSPSAGCIQEGATVAETGVPPPTETSAAPSNTVATAATAESDAASARPASFNSKPMAPLPLSRPPADSDEAIAMALAQSLEDQSVAEDIRRPGEEVSVGYLVELGLIFERQPDGSDTCAIHSLNNIAQPARSPDELAAASALVVAAAAAADEGDDIEVSGLTSLFGLDDLQEAEAESRQGELQASFLMPSDKQLSVLRMISSGSMHAKARTGMFDIEAVKIAALIKGYEVIDIEPQPMWTNADAAGYVEAARATTLHNDDRWFLGFLVYERIPGRAMHYYVILRWLVADPQTGHPREMWLLLDSMDRGSKKSRNRVLTYEQMVEFYNQNSEWFKSWLVRWYPVVRKTAAATALQKLLKDRLMSACAGDVDHEVVGEAVVSTHRAEETLDSESVRWNVDVAANQLLSCALLINRELQVLRLALSEKQARRELSRAGWDLEQAVERRAKRVLRLCREAGPAEEQLPERNASGDTADHDDLVGAMEAPLPQMLQEPGATYIALGLSDWDVRVAALLLLLSARAAHPSASVMERLFATQSALKTCDWDIDSALMVLLLIQAAREQNANTPNSEEAGVASQPCAETELSEEAARDALACVDFDKKRALQILEVRRNFPTAPLAVCAEALRRGDSHTAAACELLREFKVRVQDLIIKVARQVKAPAPAHSVVPMSHASDMSPDDVAEAAEIAVATLDAAEWNPAVAFCTAESYALGLIQVRAHLQAFEVALRKRAVAIVHGQGANEHLIAAALAALDAMDSARQKYPGPTRTLATLSATDMNPHQAAARLWDEMVPPNVVAPIVDTERRPEKVQSLETAAVEIPERVAPTAGQGQLGSTVPKAKAKVAPQAKVAPKAKADIASKVKKKASDCNLM